MGAGGPLEAIERGLGDREFIEIPGHGTSYSQFILPMLQR
jgi:hypothetical protein